MTITARHTARRLTKINPMHADILTRLPMAVTAIRAAQEERLDDAKVKAAAGGDADGRRSQGGHTDPTATTAMQNMTMSDRYLDAIADDLGAFIQAAIRLVDHCDRWVISNGNAEEHPRCTGGGSVAEWTDPT